MLPPLCRHAHHSALPLPRGQQHAASPFMCAQVLIECPDVFIKEGTAFFPGSSLTGGLGMYVQRMSL